MTMFRQIKSPLPAILLRTAAGLLAGFGILATGGQCLGQEVTIQVANADEIVASLPDTSLVKDVFEAIDRDLSSVAFHRDARSVTPQDLTNQLIVLSAPDAVTNSNFAVRNGVATFRLSPVEDFPAFLESIDYGEVVSEDASTLIVRVKIHVDELKPDKLMARAEKKGDDEADMLEALLNGNSRSKKPSFPMDGRFDLPGMSDEPDEPDVRERLGADYAEGDYVEILLEGKPHVGTVLAVEEGTFGKAQAHVRLTDTQPLQKQLKRSLRRRLEKAEEFAFWAPVERLRRLTGPPADAPEERTWQDATGKFKVAATYQKLDGQSVVLKLSNGKETRVPLARLSDADRAYVQQLQEKADNPFVATPTANPAAGRSLRADWRNVKRISLSNSSNWRWKPPAVSRPNVVASSVDRIDLDTPTGDSPFGTKLVKLSISPDGGSAVAVMEVGHMDTRTHLQHLDLKSGAADQLVDCPLESRVLDALPADKLVALTTEDHGDNSTRLFIQKLRNGTLEAVTDLDTDVPGSFFHGIDHARILDGSRVLVCSKSDRWTIWDFTTGEAVYTFELDAGFNPRVALGPSGRFLFAGGSNAIVVVDLDAGKQVASLAHNFSRLGELSVDDRLKRLAISSGDNLYTVDLSTGKPTNALFGFPHDCDVDFLGKFLLVENRYIVAPEYPIFLWQYVMADGASYDNHATLRGRQLWYASRHGQQSGISWSVSSVPVPHDAVRDKFKELGDLDDLIILKENDPVTIVADTDLDAATEESLVKATTDTFRAAGYKIVAAEDADEKTKKVIVTCKKASEPVTVQIGNPDAKPPDADERPDQQLARNHNLPAWVLLHSGPRGGAFGWMWEDHTITPYQSSISIRLGDKEIWTDGLRVREGQRYWPINKETPQDVIARITQPNTERLLELTLPAQMCKPGPVGGAYGASLLNADGIVSDYLGEGRKE
ncbi:hypothetical protein Pla108_14560 [Botrimarina colliarenosi]|uniref:SLA1 homology domain-containing protein n=1 Tax=Botrimarina colliarenosi TaxID=2528001 RepID=A0A5C6AQN0_9BACT|nr:SHD1 domain-containing protein [Botrimarina colliarenosi]TWU00504.1 hypothetical protein Pla108_14560 [Botrimarina colliarenosi]